MVRFFAQAGETDCQQLERNTDRKALERKKTILAASSRMERTNLDNRPTHAIIQACNEYTQFLLCMEF